MSGSDTRARLIAATHDHLNRHGLDGLTLREIARLSGVSHGAPMRHFDGLSSLLAAVAATGFDELHVRVAAAVDLAGADPLRSLRDAGRAYVEFAVAQSGPFELMFRPELLDRTDPEYLASSLRAFEQLSDLVVDAQSTGWFAGLETAHLTGVLWAGVHGIAALWIQGSLPAATGAGIFDPFLHVFQTDLARLPGERS